MHCMLYLLPLSRSWLSTKAAGNANIMDIAGSFQRILSHRVTALSYVSKHTVPQNSILQPRLSASPREVPDVYHAICLLQTVLSMPP